MLSFLLTVILSEPNQKQGEEKLNSNRNEKRKKLTIGIISLITPPPPHVIFVNFLVDHHPFSSCDVLFEWPLTCFYYLSLSLHLIWIFLMSLICSSDVLKYFYPSFLYSRLMRLCSARMQLPQN